MSNEKTYWQITNNDIPSPNQKILNEYLLSIKLANYAETTIKKYRGVLQQFFIECTYPIEELTSDDVLHWYKKYLIGKKPGSINVDLSIISSFFKFCLAEDYLEKVITKKHWRPKVQKPLPKYLTEQEYARVILAAERLPPRDRFLILLLATSGCRRSEAVQLNVEDVDSDKRTITIKGKGKKIRSIHFSEECALVLNDYLKTRSGNKKEPMFLNKLGNRLSGNGIYVITIKLGKMAGLTRPLHPHCFRHTFATNMLARGATLEFIADELGHSNLDTTRVYARIPMEELILTYQNKMG